MTILPADMESRSARPVRPSWHRKLRHPRWLGLLVILLAVTAIAVPGMNAPLFTDDIHQLDRNAGFSSWTDIFKPDAFSFYRPVKNAIFALVSPWRESLVRWHIVGLACFLLATAGVHRIATIVLGAGLPAWIATSVWALSPTCVSTILWLSCANISLGIAFAGLAFHFHERSWREGRVPLLLAAAAAQLAALFCYEALVAILPLLFLRDIQAGRIRTRRMAILRHASYAAGFVAYLVLRIGLSSKTLGDATFHAGFSPDMDRWRLFLSAPWFLWRHVLMWIFPFGKIEVLGTYVWMKSASPGSLAFAWFFLAAFASTGIVLWKRMPAVSYGILAFLIASFPAGNFLPTFNGPIHDAYLTIPSIGLAIAFAGLAGSLWASSRGGKVKWRRAAPAMVPILVLMISYRLLLCSAYSAYWSSVWAEPQKLLLLVAESRPYQFNAKGMASYQLFCDGYIEQAEQIAISALEDAPWCMQAKLTLGLIHEERFRHRDAETIFREIADQAGPRNLVTGSALAGLARVLAADPARLTEAAGICRTLLQADAAAQSPRIVELLADIYRRQGDRSKALRTVDRGLGLHPDDQGLLRLRQTLTEGNPTAATSQHLPPANP